MLQKLGLQPTNPGRKHLGFYPKPENRKSSSLTALKTPKALQETPESLQKEPSKDHQKALPSSTPLEEPLKEPFKPTLQGPLKATR